MASTPDPQPRSSAAPEGCSAHSASRRMRVVGCVPAPNAESSASTTSSNPAGAAGAHSGRTQPVRDDDRLVVEAAALLRVVGHVALVQRRAERSAGGVHLLALRVAAHAQLDRVAARDLDHAVGREQQQFVEHVLRGRGRDAQRELAHQTRRTVAWPVIRTIPRSASRSVARITRTSTASPGSPSVKVD